ncbi:MAG: hypothetical protein M0Z43_02150 [Acidithiobacillus sp.]|nr:hypothetical protein [Acidithiobacillus sp.]
MNRKLLCLTAILLCAILIASLAWAGKLRRGGGVAATVANGEVGNKAGAVDDTPSPTSYPGNDQGLSSCFEATASGQISYIHAYLGYSSGSTGQQYNAAIYDATGSTLYRDGSLSDGGGTIPGRTTIALDSPYTITSGTTYCLSFGAHNSPDGWNIGATYQVGANVYYDATYTVGATMPATVDVTTVKTSGEILRLWATNTADGS